MLTRCQALLPSWGSWCRPPLAAEGAVPGALAAGLRRRAPRLRLWACGAARRRGGASAGRPWARAGGGGAPHRRGAGRGRGRPARQATCAAKAPATAASRCSLAPVGVGTGVSVVRRAWGPPLQRRRYVMARGGALRLPWCWAGVGASLWGRGGRAQPGNGGPGRGRPLKGGARGGGWRLPSSAAVPGSGRWRLYVGPPPPPEACAHPMMPPGRVKPPLRRPGAEAHV